MDTDLDNEDSSRHGNDVYIMNTKNEERATSFFAQPGILAGTYKKLAELCTHRMNLCDAKLMLCSIYNKLELFKF